MWDLKQYSDNVAIINEAGDKLSYADLQVATEKLAEQISARCLVFCLCTNNVGSLLGYVTFINHNIVPVMLDAQIDSQFFAKLTASYQPDYFWLPSERVADFEDYQVVYSDCDYTLLKTSHTAAYALFSKLALLLTTSGSTGSPKLVRQSYDNIKSNMQAITSYLEIDETERSITTLPMNYTYGLSIINSHLCAGASLILTQQTIVQKNFWQQLKDFNATSFGGVPYTYEMLDRLRFYKLQLPALRTMTQAGGKLLPALHEKIARYAKETGKRFYVMYGQTEATARMSYLPYEQSLDKYGSIGIAIPGGKLSILDEHGDVIESTDMTGELMYEGQNVMLGYAEQGADLNKSDECAGKLLTGDMVKVDEDGYYWVVGRKKRFIKIYGNRLNLDEMEQLLKAQFAPVDIACSGLDDKMYIFICNDELSNVKINTLLEKVKDYTVNKTQLNQSAFYMKAINCIPKNKSGKISYKDLEEYYDA
ncbi:AMP-binding protein [sulfur-oxidizing endosymbiont of Gigantopelta aegis]|uniref:AMP-binding protein n=1 Tax=sulfur-oxidizing endosymbiont of Gigantopelta aegis TaxID=2794934 RepID=UPI0018DC1F53|nr:AMP-binding protein [sulfur-oxidizing endosymbiont of Gigantopelta aegis]